MARGRVQVEPPDELDDAGTLYAGERNTEGAADMEKPIFSFMGVPITEDSAGKLAEAMKKSGVSALEVVTACETLKKISKALLDELPGVTEEEHND